MAEYPAHLRAEIEKYERKHEENPQGRNFVPLANAYRKAGELQLAEGLLRDGIRLHPDYLSAHIVLGRVLADRGASAEAAAEFRHVLSVDPQNLIALRTMGELAVGDGRADEAGYWFRELLVVDPMNDEARAALAELDAAPADADEFEGGGDWWQGEVEPGPEGEAAFSERVDANAPPEPEADPDAGSESQPQAQREPERETDPERDREPEPEPEGASPEDDAVPSAAAGADEDSGPDEGTAVVPAEHHPIAPTHESLLGEAAGSEEERREPVDGDLVESGAWDAPPVEYEIDAPNAERPAPAGAGEELASETLAELYARQGFTEEAARMYRELIRRRGEEPHLVQRLSELERTAAAADDSGNAWADDSDPSPQDVETPDAAWSAESDAAASIPGSSDRDEREEDAPARDDQVETADRFDGTGRIRRSIRGLVPRRFRNRGGAGGRIRRGRAWRRRSR
jgi:tetratricopeptide (TPR) repeat protein